MTYIRGQEDEMGVLKTAAYVFRGDKPNCALSRTSNTPQPRHQGPPCPYQPQHFIWNFIFQTLKIIFPPPPLSRSKHTPKIDENEAEGRHEILSRDLTLREWRAGGNAVCRLRFGTTFRQGYPGLLGP